MAYWWLSPIGSPPVEILGRVLNEGSIREALSSPARLIESRAVIFLFALAVIARCYFWRRTAALILAVVALVAWGLFERAVYYRYPGAWYLLATPFIGPAYLAGNIEFAGRLATASAAAAWLFLLRPFLVGRWPDIQILPAVALVLWQKKRAVLFRLGLFEALAGRLLVSLLRKTCTHVLERVEGHELVGALGIR